MASETTTPNIGLQVPSYNQGNWQVPTNYNWNLIDLIFGGSHHRARTERGHAHRR